MTNLIGNRIKNLREEEGLTQKELGEAINVTREAVARWETAERDIKTEATIALANFFGVTSDYLLGLSDVTTTNKDLQAVCDYTGLDDFNVSLLNGYKRTEQKQIQEFGYSFMTGELQILNSVVAQIAGEVLAALRTSLGAMRIIEIHKKEHPDFNWSDLDNQVDIERQYVSTGTAHIAYQSKNETDIQMRLIKKYMELQDHQQFMLYRLSQSISASIERFVKSKENEYKDMALCELQELHNNTKKTLKEVHWDGYILDDGPESKS